MRILVLSDLHTEFVSQFWRLPQRLPKFDVAVLAGDIARSPRQAVHFGHESFPDRPVIVVAGNHEFYGREIEASLRTGKEYAGTTGHVHLLDRDVVVIDGVRFVGATLWTDYRLHGQQEWSMAMAARGLNDHVRIERRGPIGSVIFSPADALERHLDDRDFVDGVLALPFSGPTVVVTHHAPHPGSVADRFSRDGLTPCFVSDLSDVIEARRPALWIHGHTHDSFDYRVGDTRVVCNPKGYGPMRPGRRLENLEFGMKVVDV